MNQSYNQSSLNQRPPMPQMPGASYIEDPQNFAHELTSPVPPVASAAPMAPVAPVAPASPVSSMSPMTAPVMPASAGGVMPQPGPLSSAMAPTAPMPLANPGATATMPSAQAPAPLMPRPGVASESEEVIEVKAEPIPNQIIGMRKSICMQARSFDELWDQAHRLSFSAVMPMPIRSTATVDHTGDVFVLLQKALRYGLDVMDAVRAFYVMPQPGGSGIGFYVSVPFKRAICKRYGSISVSIDKATCVATAHGRRFDTGEEMSESFGAEDAALRGQMARNARGFWEGKPKSSWEKHWPEMLKNRALGKLLDALFPDVVFGLATLEEALDEEAFAREYLAQQAQYARENNLSTVLHDSSLSEAQSLEAPDNAPMVGAAAFLAPREESIQERVSRKVTQNRRGKTLNKSTPFTAGEPNPTESPYQTVVPPMPPLNHEQAGASMAPHAPEQEQAAPNVSANPWQALVNPLEAPRLDGNEAPNPNVTSVTPAPVNSNPTV